MDIAQMFINLSAEYPALLHFIVIVFAACGVIISASAVFDFIKAGRRESHHSAGNAILWKGLGGASLVDLSFWARTWTDTLWADSDPLDIGSAAASSGDYFSTALIAVLGFITLAGYVVIGKAYLQATKLGYVAPDQRGDLIGSILSRIIAGSAMIASMHLSSYIENSIRGFSF